MDLAHLLPPDTSVGLLYVGEPPVLTRVQVVRAVETTVLLALRSEAEIPTGARVILELPLRGEPRAIAEVVRHDEGLLEVRLRPTVPPERRPFPRFRGWVHVRARVGTEEQAEPWLAGADVLAVEHAPHPDVEVSASGIAFDDAAFARVGDLLLLSVGIPREPGPQRALGRVTQVRALAPEEAAKGSRATHRIHVALDTRSADVLSALARYGFRVQQAFSGVPEKRLQSRRVR